MSNRNDAMHDHANHGLTSDTTDVHQIGTRVGAAWDDLSGGLAGKRVADGIDPTHEDAYWRKHYSARPYVERDSSYSDYGPAYAFGVDAFGRYPGCTFDDIEPEIARQWTIDGGASTLRWDRARPAVREAWNRVNGTA